LNRVPNPEPVPKFLEPVPVPVGPVPDLNPPPELDLTNGSFGSGTDRVKFGSGQLRVKSIRVEYGFGSGSGLVRVNH